MLDRKPRPATVDAVVIRDSCVLLVKRGTEPFKGSWALPGGFVEWGETAENAVVREAFEETGLRVRVEELLGVYSAPARDPERGTIAVAFICSAQNGQPKGGDDAAEAKWWALEFLPSLCFDHDQILSDAKKKLAQKNSQIICKY